MCINIGSSLANTEYITNKVKKVSKNAVENKKTALFFAQFAEISEFEVLFALFGLADHNFNAFNDPFLVIGRKSGKLFGQIGCLVII